MASTKRVMQSWSILSLVLVLSVALASVKASVRPITSNLPPYTFAGTGNSYQIYLSRYIDFTSAKYPLTISAPGLGDKPGYTYLDSFYSADLDKSSTYTSLKTVLMLDHNNFLVSGDVSGAANPSFDVVYCGSPKGLNLGCEAQKIVMDKSTVELGTSYTLEDARFDPRSGVFITAWRDFTAKKLVLYIADTTRDPKTKVSKSVSIDLNVSTDPEKPKYAISNRARIEFQTKLDGNNQEYTQVYIFDHYTGLASDQYFSTTFLSAKINGSVYMVGAQVDITADHSFQADGENFTGQIDVTTISTIYEHEN